MKGDDDLDGGEGLRIRSELVKLALSVDLDVLDHLVLHTQRIVTLCDKSTKKLT